MVRLEHKTLIFYYLGTEIPKSRSVLIFRGPPGPVCHIQNENSFSQFVRIRQTKSHFCQLKGALQVQVQVEPKIFFSKKCFNWPLRGVLKKLGHLGLSTPKVWRDLNGKFFINELIKKSKNPASQIWWGWANGNKLVLSTSSSTTGEFKDGRTQFANT